MNNKNIMKGVTGSKESSPGEEKIPTMQKRLQLNDYYIEGLKLQ